MCLLNFLRSGRACYKPMTITVERSALPHHSSEGVGPLPPALAAQLLPWIESLMAIRLVLASPEPILVYGLEHLFGAEPAIELSVFRRSAREAVAELQEAPPDVLLLDVSLDDEGDLAALRQLSPPCRSRLRRSCWWHRRAGGAARDPGAGGARGAGQGDGAAPLHRVRAQGGAGREMGRAALGGAGAGADGAARGRDPRSSPASSRRASSTSCRWSPRG